MAENSKIEWTRHTWNPWIGCTKVEAACDHWDDESDDFDDVDEFDCHMGPGGYCGAAGSEDCEFECPYRRAQREQSRRRRRTAPLLDGLDSANA